MLKSIILVAAAALAAPAIAQAPATGAGEEEKVKDPDRKICERVSKIGSRLNFVTVCMTAEEWKTLRLNHRQHTEGLQRIVNQEPIR